MPIEIKKSPYLFAFAGLLVVATLGLVLHKDVSFKVGAAFLTGALAMPGLFGAKKDEPELATTTTPEPALPLLNTPIMYDSLPGRSSPERARGTVEVPKGGAK